MTKCQCECAERSGSGLAQCARATMCWCCGTDSHTQIDGDNDGGGWTEVIKRTSEWVFSVCVCVCVKASVLCVCYVLGRVLRSGRTWITFHS